MFFVFCRFTFAENKSATKELRRWFDDNFMGMVMSKINP